MKLAIVGSREFTDYDKMCKFIASRFDIDTIDCIVSGGAKGADSLAERFASEHNISTKIFKPDWKRYGRAAGPIRNRSIVEYADAVVAFPTSSSKGTVNSMKLARELRKRLEVCYV